jgi:hypothetical protein
MDAGRRAQRAEVAGVLGHQHPPLVDAEPQEGVVGQPKEAAVAA